jgi:hydroxyacid-oxoacid transhydrogenase
MDRVDRDTAFEMSVASVRYGAGVTREVGMDLADRGIHRALVVTDPVVARLSPLRTVVESLDDNRVEAVVYDRVRVEPTEESWLDAIAFASRETFGAVVAV